MKRFILTASTALALAGCTVGPDFKSPTPDRPVTFGSTRPDVRSTTYGGAMEEAWWKSFHDHELDTLMDRLARKNLDLQAAMERVTQARARFRLTRAESLPQLDASFTYDRNHLSQNGIVSLLQPAPGASLTNNQFDPKLTASWEVDLFGRVCRLTEAARAGVQVSEEDRNAIALSVSTELAETYFRYRETRALEALTLKNAALAERRLTLVDGLVRYGAAPALSDAQARAQLSRIRQALPALRARQNELANAIALLLDAPPRALESELERDAALQPDVPHLVAIGLPADVIRRRPDVRRSEAQLHMATASTGAAVASFYPDITFSSGFGVDSLHTGSLFQWAARSFSIEPSISLPIFHGGALSASLKLAKAQQREAAIGFHETVLNAWHEVDNALVSYAEAQETQTDASATAQANTRALTLASEQFQHGAGNFLDVVDAQSALVSSQSATVQANAGQEIALVTLYRSLGGGWQYLNSGMPMSSAAAGRPGVGASQKTGPTG